MSVSALPIFWKEVEVPTWTNAVLTVKETEKGPVLKQLDVNTYRLAAYSTVFHRLFAGSHKGRESGQGQFEIVQPKVEALETMHALLDVNNEVVVVNQDNVDDLLSLSDLYLVDVVRKMCLNFLKNHYPGSQLAKLRIAEKHRLVDLEPTIGAICLNLGCQLDERIAISHEAVNSRDAFDQLGLLLCLGGQYIKKVITFGDCDADPDSKPFWLEMDIVGALMKAALEAEDTTQIVGDIMFFFAPPLPMTGFNKTVTKEISHIDVDGLFKAQDTITTKRRKHRLTLTNKPTGKTFSLEVCLDKQNTHFLLFGMYGGSGNN